VPTATLALGSGANQHYGLMQIDAVYGQNAGEPAVRRLAAQIVSLFKRGSVFTKDGYAARIWKAPYLGPLMKDDPWVFVPVSIPFIAFATDPA
jgi:hypothetical protein